MLLFAPLLGCTPDDPDPSRPPTGDAPTDDTGRPPEDTGPEGGSLAAVYWGLSARFAIDGANGRAVAFGDRDEGLQPISFTVTLLSEEALTVGPTEETSCSATFSMDGPLPAAAWTADEGAWFGADLPLGEDVRDTCRFYGLPQPFRGELAAHVRRWTWGVGVLPLSDEVEDALRAQLPASEWDALAPYVFGAGARSSVFAQGTAGSGWIGAGYGLAFAVDDSFVLAESGLGDPVPLPVEEVWDGSTLGTGTVEVQIGVFDQPELLTSTPY